MSLSAADLADLCRYRDEYRLPASRMLRAVLAGDVAAALIIISRPSQRGQYGVALLASQWCRDNLLSEAWHSASAVNRWTSLESAHV